MAISNLYSIWDWKDTRKEINFEDARSLASDKWNLDNVCFFPFGEFQKFFTCLLVFLILIPLDAPMPDGIGIFRLVSKFSLVFFGSYLIFLYLEIDRSRLVF